MIFLKYKVFKINVALVSLLLICALAFSASLTLTGITVTANQDTRKIPIYSVETEKKQVAVTFDAAWSAEDTDELISILNNHGAKATFYMVGDWVTQNPEAVLKLYNAGHEMGNHSDSHPSYSNISREEIRKQLNDCNEKIEEVTGEKPKTARAPSGDYDNKSIEVTESFGMKMIQWDVDSLDWKLLSVDEMYDRVIEKTQNGSIILFHNGVENTPEALDKILTKLKADGYEFVTVSELIYWDNYEIDHTGRQIKTR